jgi:[ribosomal protein S5]-alanine N-acetyltransferase
MRICTSRLLLRDFMAPDRAAFISYQMDPRYRRLYGFGDADEQRVGDLFDLFISWQREAPRLNFQVGIFERDTGRLCGCAGLRQASQNEGTAVLGIELTPDDWGRYRLAIEVAGALVEHGFRDLDLRTIVGDTASGNRRVEKLACWFGASITGRRDGPEWMAARGWQEVDWALTRDGWDEAKRKRRLRAGSGRIPAVSPEVPRGRRWSRA